MNGFASLGDTGLYYRSAVGDSDAHSGAVVIIYTVGTYNGGAQRSEAENAAQLVAVDVIAFHFHHGHLIGIDDDCALELSDCAVEQLQIGPLDQQASAVVVTTAHELAVLEVQVGSLVARHAHHGIRTLSYQETNSVIITSS